MIYNEINKSHTKINHRNIRIAILAAILVTLTMIMSISAIRTRFVDFIISVYEKFVCLSIDEDEYDYPKTIEKTYKPAYIPLGYTNSNFINQPVTNKMEWRNQYKSIKLYQNVISRKNALNLSTIKTLRF